MKKFFDSLIHLVQRWTEGDRKLSFEFQKEIKWTGYEKTTMKYDEINWNKMVSLGLKLLGKPYIFGIEVNLHDPDPTHIKGLDCSELVEWLYTQIELPILDGSYNQVKQTKPITSNAVKIGDLGFKANPENGVVHHVGVYIGDGKVLEAKGIAWGTILTDKFVFETSTHFFRWGRHIAIED